MKWGSIIGTQKGPFLIWEMESGNINSVKYCDRIIPLITTVKAEYPNMLLMQDGAPPHTARRTREAPQNVGIDLLDWPPFSPDLNPIESLWDTLKDYLQSHYPDIDIRLQMPSTRLHEIIQEAWNSISLHESERVIGSKPETCQAVIKAEGGHAKY